MQNTTIEDNLILGSPAGDMAVGISPNGTEVYASPQLTVWQWPDGPFTMSDPQTSVAEAVIENIARPELASIQSVRPRGSPAAACVEVMFKRVR